MPELAVVGLVNPVKSNPLGDEGGEDAAPEEDEAILSRTSEGLEDEYAAEAITFGIPSPSVLEHTTVVEGETNVFTSILPYRSDR
mmetsp:Transcript_10202/g.23885  ORF Transcript_10202/g.23885 Transcript_10202/m.23885 type:complete len:85 (+) Transcript_10202:264-518(+)